MDMRPTPGTIGADAVIEPTRSSRRASAAPQVQPLRPNPEFMHNPVANDLVQRFSAYQQRSADLVRDTDTIRRAYAVAYEAHAPQKRASGEPYIDHPVAVANLLLDLRLDVNSIAAALLHDVVEDTTVTKEQVAQAFGSEVAHLVDGVTKLSALEAQTKEEAQIGTYRKMFIAMADDPRVVRLGEGLAKLGLTVMLLQSEQLDADIVEPGEIDRMVGAFEWLEQQPYAGPHIGMSGFSVGASLLTVAAADVRIRDRVAVVNAFGGYGSLRRLALVDRSRVHASLKVYDFDAVIDGRRVGVCGLGAVFTQPESRGQGHARVLIEQVLERAAANGQQFALLFSEIGLDYYARLGFTAVPMHDTTFRVAPPPQRGAPATLVRAGDDRDLDAIVALGQKHAEPFRFRLDRDRSYIQYAIAKQRLRAGLVAHGTRSLEFFVTEEGATAVAYVETTDGNGNINLNGKADALLQARQRRSSEPQVALLTKDIDQLTGELQQLRTTIRQRGSNSRTKLISAGSNPRSSSALGRRSRAIPRRRSSACVTRSIKSLIESRSCDSLVWRSSRRRRTRTSARISV